MVERSEKLKKNMISLTGKPEDIEKIKSFCEAEGLYMGRFLVKLAVRYIEEVESDRVRKTLDRLTNR